MNDEQKRRNGQRNRRAVSLTRASSSLKIPRQLGVDHLLPNFGIRWTCAWQLRTWFCFKLDQPLMSSDHVDKHPQRSRSPRYYRQPSPQRRRRSRSKSRLQSLGKLGVRMNKLRINQLFPKLDFGSDSSTCCCSLSSREAACPRRGVGLPKKHAHRRPPQKLTI